MTWIPEWMRKAPEPKPFHAPKRYRVGVYQPLFTMTAHCLAIREVTAYDETQAIRILSDEWSRVFKGLSYTCEPLRLTWHSLDSLMPYVVEVGQ